MALYFAIVAHAVTLVCEDAVRHEVSGRVAREAVGVARRESRGHGVGKTAIHRPPVSAARVLEVAPGIIRCRGRDGGGRLRCGLGGARLQPG